MTLGCKFWLEFGIGVWGLELGIGMEDWDWGLGLGIEIGDWDWGLGWDDKARVYGESMVY